MKIRWACARLIREEQDLFGKIRRKNHIKKISRRSFLAVCGAMAATAALTACGGSSASTAGTTASGSTAGSAAGSAASGEVFELKLSTTQTDTSMIYQGLQAAADKVAEDTDGHVKVTIYPSSQLGGEEDMIDQALQGMGIAVLTDAGRLSSYVNDIGIMNMATSWTTTRTA